MCLLHPNRPACFIVESMQVNQPQQGGIVIALMQVRSGKACTISMQLRFGP